jgi:hypothetical protein
MFGEDMMIQSRGVVQTLVSATRIQADADVRQAALNYVAGWNRGDVDLMRASLHPDLAKRIIRYGSQLTSWPPGDRLEEMSRLRLCQLTRHDPVPEYGKSARVLILDRLEDTASLKIGGDTAPFGGPGGEYDHFVKWNGSWLNLHVLWGFQPLAPDDSDESTTITDIASSYVESCLACDASRLERTLHPQLVKDVVIPDGAPGWHEIPGDCLYRISADTLLYLVAGAANARPADEQLPEITLLDRAANAASVRIDTEAWTEYLHLCKWNGCWLIINSVRVNRRDRHLM